MNERLCNIRRLIMRELEDEEKVDLKGKRWHFNRNEENLCKQAREELESCCHLYQELGIAHGLKEAQEEYTKFAMWSLSKMLWFTGVKKPKPLR